MTKDEMASLTHLSKLWKIVEDRRAWCTTVLGVTKSEHNLATE